MRVTMDARARRLVARLPVASGYALVRAALVVLLAVQAARLVWALLTPLGPVGAWQSVPPLPQPDAVFLARFDPTNRLAASAPAAVSSLPLKLFGVRLDGVAGQGSAIIQTQEGVQGSFAVGDELVPGVRLKSVAFDSVLVERGGGILEQLFLDQSKPATPVTVAAAAALTGAPAAPPAASATATAGGIAFTPRTVGGQTQGFVVAPADNGAAFAAAGLRPGDVVTAINGATPRSPAEALAAASERPMSGIITYTVVRDGKTLTFNTQAPGQ